MSLDAKTLYELLPAVYRVRDIEQGGPLQALIAAIAEQVAVLDENLAQLYDDQFIETCAEWVVPYIGDLVGARGLHGVTPKISSPRAAVAHTIGNRRRKGTATMLEQLARDVTGWDARVVEFFSLLATTQYMNHLRPGNLYAPHLRKWEPLERLGTAFETTPHTLDVRNIARGHGRYNIPNIGIFLWRLPDYRLSAAEAFSLKDGQRYLFNRLGCNTPLATRAEPVDEVTRPGTPLNVPMPISRRVLHEGLKIYYGADRSLVVQADGAEIPKENIVVCNLADAPGGVWAHQPPAGKVAVDPVLGRLAFGAAEADRHVQVTYHYNFSADLGGGEYERQAAAGPVRKVTAPGKIADSLGTPDDGGVIEIADNATYGETLSIQVSKGANLEIRAADQRWPMVELGGELKIDGKDGAEVTLNGLLISGAGLRVTGTLARLRLVHCTLVPGFSVAIDFTPAQPAPPSLIVEAPGTAVEIDHCIVGGLRGGEGTTFTIKNSIVDALSADGVAFAAPDGAAAGGTLHVENATLIGKVHTTFLELGSNTIFLAALAAGDTFTGPVWADRTQAGCVRFSYVPPGSLMPRRFHCRPAEGDDPLRLLPQFTSLRYGDPGYGQLSLRCAPEIRQGAEDESEMGALHDLFEPQRAANLAVALDEYLRFGLEAGVFYAS